ncbi:DUF3883 domain-containing protein [Flavobacterium suncheonense]|uniref:Protein NO VEIN C-terminal domain-containing protein n=1 Tax=Flavobacterium suncheonense GH29-5 = DSM 17707 TaxID=1121899 RepID=A0A0A2MC02_9FLAO|nr:DUF3883 domain-containing protein [Flavobacterium suncheonense]KGO88993.1 hypothetical protein Q764_10335 [Flavobacterium suncheonense GH29-5 = DSM 17707]
MSNDTLLNKQTVENLIAENYNTYKSHSRIISDYRGEKGLTEAYNGRQLLEMLQNADDAQTDKVHLHLDTENTTLTIANNGIPFDIKGLGSLMLANNSPKNKRDFIGNKGLGFRSILNWVNVVKIKTRECILEFSSSIAKKEFEKLIPDVTIRQQIIDNEKDLSNGDVPFAVLAIPDFKENTEVQDWETIIELKYKKSEENKILEQLEKITPEVLLFLNHTIYIKISGAGNIDKELILSPSRDKIEKIITVNNTTWNLFDSGEQGLPNNVEKFFKYKIAWQNDLSDNEAYFATYFPTQVATHLPYLIHATFDLDPSRNHLNKSDDNEHILNQIATTIREIAITSIVNNDNPDWRALEFLTVNGKSENKLLETFFENIERAKSELPIYPTLDGFYKKIDEVKFYGNDFSEWVIRNKIEAFFPNLLLPIPPNKIALTSKIASKYKREEWKSILDTVTHKIINIDERVHLIKLLENDKFKELHGTSFPLLLDQDGNIVKSDIEVFTLRKGSTDIYQIPDYVNISFINDSLYFKLENVFSEEIEKLKNSPTEHKSRALKKIIAKIVNLGSNDITDVVRNITRSFNSKVEEDTSKSQELIKPFINSLYQIFKQKKEGEKTAVDNIKIINRSGNLVLASDVFLGKEYYYGKATEKIFEGVFEEDQYLIGNEFWNLDFENQSPDYLDSFFIWLGVNKYSKIKNTKQTVYQYNGLNEYTKYVFNKVGTPDLYTSVSYDIEQIEYFDMFISKKMVIEKMLAWIILDKKLLSKIDDETNGETFTYSYSNTLRTINLKPSYFLYQIAKSKVIDNLFVDFELADILGLKSINPKHPIFLELGISDTAVLDTLKKIGAKMSFKDLTIDVVYGLLNGLKIKNTEFKNARKIYQQAFNYFKNHKQQDFSSYPKQTHLVAVKNGQKEYKLTQEIYYSDNTTLPSKIIEDFWIFDFPKRSGEKQIADYFGIKTFKDISIEILKDKILDHPKKEEFNNWFNKIKPFLLTYRLNNINSETLAKTTVHDIKSSNIKIVSSLEYIINNGEPKALLSNEFVNNDKHTFYIGADSNLNLEQLKDTPAFCEAFSEILCVLFEVNENKDDFRAIFKDKEHLKDSKYLVETKMLLDKYEEACLLLGLSKNEMLFWKAITDGKINDFPETLSNTDDLQVILKKTINYNLPVDYHLVDFDAFNNIQSYNFIKAICATLNYTLEEIKSRLENFTGLYYWHLERFKQAALNVEILWNKAWWLYFSNKSAEEQKTFENKRNLYLQKRDEIIIKLAKECALTIEIDYEQKLLNKLSLDYKIAITKDNIENIKIENKYKHLIEKYNIAIEDLGLEIKSLLFFEGHDEELKNIFTEIVKKELEDTVSPISPQTEGTEMNSIITSIEAGTAPTQKLNNNFGNKKGGVHSSKKEKQKQKAGKRAEKLVFYRLKELYPDGEIRWVSGNSEDNSITLDDTKGYDISYKKNKTDDQWKYLEVKSSAGNSFIISNNEVSVGIENKDNYHLALVNSHDIYFIEDFFLDEERVSEFKALRNSTSIRPIDFEVYYNIPKLKST